MFRVFVTRFYFFLWYYSVLDPGITLVRESPIARVFRDR